MSIGISELIETLKEELKNSLTNDPMFKLESAEITVNFAVTESSDANGKLSLYVLEVGGTSAAELARSHQISIRLQPIGPDPLLLGDD